MLSVKWLCVVMVPTRLETLPGADEATFKDVDVLIEPRSTKRYSNFHVQFVGTTLPSMPAPAAKPMLVFD